MRLRIWAAAGLALLLVSAASAADIAGKWQAGIPGRMGDMQMVFDFKLDGDKLTGTIANEMMGESEIQDGKIEGDTITFKQVMERRRVITFTYTGKIKGDEIEFTREVEGMAGAREGRRPPEGGAREGGRRGGMGRKVTFTAKRAP